MPEIAATTGHNLRQVAAILDAHYLNGNGTGLFANLGASSSKAISGKRNTNFGAFFGQKQTSNNASSTGRIASSLKGLNAYHANINAWENASPNSQVGKIAAYASSEECMAYQAAFEAIEDAISTIAEIEGNEGVTVEIVDELTGEVVVYTPTEDDPEVLEPNDQLSADYNSALTRIDDSDVEGAQSEMDAAFAELTGGREVTDEARVHFERELSNKLSELAASDETDIVATNEKLIEG